MKALLRPVLVLGTAVALAGGGMMLAHASWSTSTTSAAFTVRAARLPQPARPTVRLTDDPAAPRIAWPAVTIAADVEVHRYIVTRHAGPAAEVVCTVPATSNPSCVDLTAPAGASLAYTVAAAHGAHWTGPAGDRSLPVSTPGTPVAVGAVPTAAAPAITGGAPAGNGGPPSAAPPPSAGPGDATPAVEGHTATTPPPSIAPAEPVPQPDVAVPGIPAATDAASSGPDGAGDDEAAG